MTWLKRRLAEPSTWAGLATIVTGAAAVAAPYSWIAIVCGAIALLLGEKS